ncbi:kallikrein-7-like [Eptesicus fuscus]|uniref:kallikrein-7-like n=1 Tax=Eptesicus fuscus TaxID=29078 RepID=UPI002403B25F|nr:kallikrein-7-like [Eptesicus fuscus]
MAGPLLSTLLLLLLSLAPGSAGQEAHGNGERIINGVHCPIGAQPWQVALFTNHRIQCAGVLVHRNWVLTVAHCRRSEYIVQMGSDLLVDPNAQKIRATETFVHPQFDTARQVHDIMLVKLSSPATLSSTVRTVNVPSSCKPPGTSCTVSGWGSTTPNVVRNTSQLMCTHVSIISYQDCRRLYPNMSTRFMLCAAAPDRQSSPCKL